MAGMYGISAYQQTHQMKPPDTAQAVKAVPEAVAAKGTEKTSGEKTTVKPWTPIASGSSLIPQKTEYGFTIGDVKLSDAARDYYETLKGKFHNMDFILVSADMKQAVQQNAGAYGNASKMVVLIDEEKLERMATDESYRNKYEGIIAMAQTKQNEAKNSLTSSGSDVKNFGMSVDSAGNEKYFAVVEKSQKLQKERIEQRAQEKRDHRIKERRRKEKEAFEKRIEDAKNKRKAEEAEDSREVTKMSEEAEPEKDYVSIEASSLEELLSKVSSYSFAKAEGVLRTEEERMLGAHIDFRG